MKMDEVIKMDEQNFREQIETQEEGYVPRPKWQVWAARLGLVIFIAFLIMYYILFFRGG